jgi:hypothetical protein
MKQKIFLKFLYEDGGISKIFVETTFHHQFLTKNVRISPIFHLGRVKAG